MHSQALSVSQHASRKEKKALLPHTHSHVSDSSDDGEQADYS